MEHLHQSGKINPYHISFARGDCPDLYIYRQKIPNSNCVKYLGMHLGIRLTWKDCMKAKKEYLNIKTKGCTGCWVVIPN